MAESSIYSFIVKIWLEESAEGTEQTAWRGHITHVPSGERRYLRDLDEIVAFIARYLEGTGVESANHEVNRLLNSQAVRPIQEDRSRKEAT